MPPIGPQFLALAQVPQADGAIPATAGQDGLFRMERQANHLGSVANEDVLLFSGFGLPHADKLIAPAGGDELAIGAVRDAEQAAVYWINAQLLGHIGIIGS